MNKCIMLFLLGVSPWVVAAITAFNNMPGTTFTFGILGLPAVLLSMAGILDIVALSGEEQSADEEADDLF